MRKIYADGKRYRDMNKDPESERLRRVRLHFYGCLGNATMIRTNAQNVQKDPNVTPEALRLAQQIESLSYQLWYEINSNIPTEWK